MARGKREVGLEDRRTKAGRLRAVPAGARFCPGCQDFPATSEFYPNKHRSDGLSPYCKPCTLARNKHRYEAGGREQIAARRRASPEAARAKDAEHAKTPGGRYKAMVGRAKRRGHADTMTFEQYTSLVSNASCIYCAGTLPEQGVGLDRIDNDLGYTFDNSVPCCTLCNLARGDRFTHAEFKIVAAGIRQVLANRRTSFGS